jgi:hypothetical protein
VGDILSVASAHTVSATLCGFMLRASRSASAHSATTRLPVGGMSGFASTHTEAVLSREFISGDIPSAAALSTWLTSLDLINICADNATVLGLCHTVILSLQSLGLNGKGIRAVEATPLGPHLAALSSLHSLELGNNGINPDGTTAHGRHLASLS